MHLTWQTEWKTIYSRIQGIEKAATFLLSSLHATEGDVYDAGHIFVLSNALSALAAIREFASTYSSDLPFPAKEALNRFLSDIASSHEGVPPKGLAGLQGTVTALTSFGAEFSHLIINHEASAQKITERAFIHLQRLLIVDQEVSAKWRKAFIESETTCEGLGAVHLLHHGIWAVKANAEGARTDLVLGTPLEVTPFIRTASEAMVLTEWKLVRTSSDTERQSRQARAQMSQYSSGALAGFELTTIRYVILVSLDSIVIPADVFDRNITYRHINIAITPSVPSKSTVFRISFEGGAQ